MPASEEMAARGSETRNALVGTRDANERVFGCSENSFTGEIVYSLSVFSPLGVTRMRFRGRLRENLRTANSLSRLGVA